MSPMKISYWLVNALDVRRRPSSQTKTNAKPEPPKPEKPKRQR